jgi:peptide/nickel transport system substrate-binding protein
MAALIKESLAKLGIDVTVQKLPDAQLTTQVVERRLQMFFDFGTSWLPTPDYTTRVFFSGTGRWNASGWNDPEVAKLVGEARYETDKAVYDAKMLEIVKRAQRDVPVALLWHPAHDAVIAKNIEGYTYWFHRGADYRDLKRT